MLRLCYQRGMPKPPPANIYKLYVSHQLKAGRKLADIALTWKTSVTETEKESLRAQLDQINLAFKKALTEWAISKHLPPLDSHKKLAEAYCIKNHLAPEVILPLSNDHSESGTDNVNPQIQHVGSSSMKKEKKAHRSRLPPYKG
ncbi:unnamed protein product [Calicophoron daubneyi]|uniref:Uncharacterized protein n=1 Tax=Calicophoron daubneyi TaxID=300641 RepID=A0AAV2T7S6_CALDB